MKKDVKVLKDFKGVNQALDETNIEDNELHTFENGRLKRYGDIGKPTKRFGYSRYNANQFLNENKPIQSLFKRPFSKVCNSLSSMLVSSRAWLTPLKSFKTLTSFFTRPFFVLLS